MAAMAKRLFGSATPSWITAVFAIVAAVFGLLGSAQKAGNKSRHLAARPSAAVMSTSSFVVASNASTANETSRGHDFGPDQVSKLKRSLELATHYAGFGDFWKDLPDEVSALKETVEDLLKQLYQSCTTTYLTNNMQDDDDYIVRLINTLGDSLKLLGVLPPPEIGDKMSKIVLSCLLPGQDGSARLPDEQVRAAMREFNELQPDELGTLTKVLMVYYSPLDKEATPEVRVSKLQDALKGSELRMLQPQACPAAESQESIGEKLLQAEALMSHHEELYAKLLDAVAILESKLVQLGKADLADKLRQPPLHWGKLVGIVLPVAVAAFAYYMSVV